ncbi:MAG TPA: COX15/CtaA family protein [Candidatus Binatia bacterium]|jgi:cytochrome c oxidase assembly protein subunit 15
MKAESGKGNSSFIPHPSSFAKWPHRLALLTAVLTLPLLFIGGLVTTKGAGLAVPDWPTTFGYNPFLYPWSKMVGNIFYEHSHRLVASAVGLLTVGLAFALWLGEKRRWLRWLGAAALALVIAQGVVGGLRVVLLEQTLAIVHACLAQAFFALAVSLALFTSREWSEKSPPVEVTDAGRLQRLSLITTGLIYLQAIFGAVLRHTGALLEIHLLFAALVALHVVLLGARILTRHFERGELLYPAFLLSALLFAQLALGLGAYLGKFVMSWPGALTVTLRTSHVVVGALMLATGVVLTVRSFRLFSHKNSAPAREFAVGTARRSGEASA